MHLTEMQKFHSFLQNFCGLNSRQFVLLLCYYLFCCYSFFILYLLYLFLLLYWIFEGVSSSIILASFLPLFSNLMSYLLPWHQYHHHPFYPIQISNENINISINNVVCNYSLPMHIDLRKLALNTWNCTYDRASPVLTKQLRHPSCHVKVYNSGKVYIVGSKSETEARQAARSIGREIQKIMGKTDQKICLRKFKINNILASCKFPFGILIDQVNRQYPKETYYEPELTVGLIWRMIEPKASIRIHTTGTIVVTGATSEADVSTAVEKIYNYVKDFRCDPTKISHAAPRKRKAKPPTRSSTEDEFASVARKIPKFEDADDVDCIEAGLNTMFADEVDIDEEL